MLIEPEHRARELFNKGWRRPLLDSRLNFQFGPNHSHDSDPNDNQRGAILPGRVPLALWPTTYARAAKCECFR